MSVKTPPPMVESTRKAQGNGWAGYHHFNIPLVGDLTLADGFVARLADRLITLINAQPRSPTKDDLMGVLEPAVVKVVCAVARHARMMADAEALRSAPEFGKFMPVDCAGYRDADGAIEAFKPFTQYNGPAMRYYKNVAAGATFDRYEYSSFAWQSDDPHKIVAQINGLGQTLRQLGAHTLVWRTRPEFIQDIDGKFKFYCRLHTLPYIVGLGNKREGEATPEA